MKLMLKNVADRVAAAAAVLTGPYSRQDGDGEATPSEARLNDFYVQKAPSAQLAFDLFEGEWSSQIPGIGLGVAELFQDPRVTWFGEQAGGFAGKRILELGPLEGGHSYMMAEAGAAEIIAIESNTRAFLKCLVVQNHLKFNTDFRLGDFTEYAKTTSERFDFVLASGVLYHMRDPAGLLCDLARISDRIGIWTHYYDYAALEASGASGTGRFETVPETETVQGRVIEKYRYNYKATLTWKGFCGGSAHFAYWMRREDLTGLLEALGYTVTIASDDPKHPHGPAITLYAERKTDAEAA